ncbi:MAG TPA: mandelate racemase/muconate lactonizing enzyme family protein [Pirellulaceae bacterium]|nr:mandelate racemase/muconate lactonizing enzyme family protein [Pirellulaceae bacterium]
MQDASDRRLNLAEYRLHRLRLELARPIGDSQVVFTDHWMTVLELTTEDGLTGVGFELQQGKPTPALAQLEAQFEYNMWPMLRGSSPFGEALRISRPRGGNVDAGTLPLAVETAAWDLVGKAADLPLYRLLGGTSPEVPAYGSTLDFHLSDDEFVSRLGDFKKTGFHAIKIKVGHPDVEWDLKRMQMATEVMGQDADLMVDANEAWSPKEAIRRSHIYNNAGFDVYWIEDPITREDYNGYAQLRGEIPFSRINTGEYLGFHGKRRLLETGGVDVLNVHGSIGMSRAAAQLAGDYGIPVSLGNTIMETGVHLAASLPEVLYLEFSDLVWNKIAKEPVKFADGKAIAPDHPGHGIELDRDALAEYSHN